MPLVRSYNKLLLNKTGLNSKKNPDIGKLAEKVDIAILQEKKINEKFPKIAA